MMGGDLAQEHQQQMMGGAGEGDDHQLNEESEADNDDQE